MFGNKLTDTSVEYNSLKELETILKKDFNLTPCLGAELEFYLSNLQNARQVGQLAKAINTEIKEEKGRGQYEIEVKPSIDIASYPRIICQMRKLITKEAAKIGIEANFRPKPFPDDYGNSMHIHFNFLEDNDAEKYAEILCHYLPLTINAFLPTKEDYQRLDSRFMAPTHVSYGGNNRSTLIRIPDSLPRRIEHRLASANADPCKVIYAILTSIISGLRSPKSIRKLSKIHGNAHDPQYNLVRIKALTIKC